MFTVSVKAAKSEATCVCSVALVRGVVVKHVNRIASSLGLEQEACSVFASSQLLLCPVRTKAQSSIWLARHTATLPTATKNWSADDKKEGHAHIVPSSLLHHQCGSCIGI